MLPHFMQTAISATLRIDYATVHAPAFPLDPGVKGAERETPVERGFPRMVRTPVFRPSALTADWRQSAATRRSRSITTSAGSLLSISSGAGLGNMS